MTNNFAVRRLRDGGRTVSVTLLGPNGVVGPVDQMITNDELTGSRSINTLIAACHDLKLWFEFLLQRELQWNLVTWNNDELLSRFVAWLRYGNQIDAEQRVIPLQLIKRRAEKTITRILGSLYRFYDFHNSTPFGKSLREYTAGQLNRQITSHKISQPRPVKVKAETRTEPPKILTNIQIQNIKNACLTKRDLFLISLLSDRGMRLGQALGVRHSDLNSRLSLLNITPRQDNANGALAKTDRTWTIPLTDALLDLHSEYMFEEYGNCLSDYLFISLQGSSKYRALTFSAVRSLMTGLRRRSGVDFHPHMLRHTFATNKISEGVPIGVVQTMLTHKNASTTSGIYTHLDVEALRRWVDAAEQSQEGQTSAPRYPDIGDPETIRRLLDGSKGMR